MARRKAKAKSRRTGHVPIPDEELIARLEKEAPEVLNAGLSEAGFDAVVEGLLNKPALSDEFPHFYCRKCGEYHLKTHPHCEAIKSRKSSQRQL
jgi:hypothetical protein